MRALCLLRTVESGGLRHARGTVRFITIPMPWDKRRAAAEEEELELIRRFKGAAASLDGSLVLPQDSQFRRWLGSSSPQLLSAGADVKKETLQEWLSHAEAELQTEAKSKLPAFSRMQWWQEGNRDVEEARLALHYVKLAGLCSQLRRNKAVFTPHVAGDVVKFSTCGRMLDVIAAYVEGDLDARLKSFWLLHDESGVGLLTEQSMDDAMYAAMAPVLSAVETVYPTLPPITKAQKKKFAKHMKNYLRDSDDYPTKLRCIFAWAPGWTPGEPGKPAERGKPRVITFDDYLKTQKENFANMHDVGSGIMELYGKVRAANFAQKADDRETFRVGIIYLIGLGVVDSWVSSL